MRIAVAARKNILVAGGTSTGKTNLVNGLLAGVSKTGDRVVLIKATRPADPAETAGDMLYLVSPAASFTTGGALNVDGGFLTA
jgi:type IV secretory pathway ATPase VirB11/archaellum biosynthesis ATPase